jgi:hypothetical protein
MDTLLTDIHTDHISKPTTTLSRTTSMCSMQFYVRTEGNWFQRDDIVSCSSEDTTRQLSITVDTYPHAFVALLQNTSFKVMEDSALVSTTVDVMEDFGT